MVLIETEAPVNGTNQSITINDGDTLTFAVNAGGHPFVIRVADGGNDITDGVTGQGATNGNVVLTTTAGGWGSDLSEFVKANIIPFKVYDAVNGTRWCVVMPSQYTYTSLHTALEMLGIVVLYVLMPLVIMVEHTRRGMMPRMCTSL